MRVLAWISLGFALLATGAVFGGALAQQSFPPRTTGPSAVIVDQMEFKNKACMDKANGDYCGLGTNSQLAFQCMDGQIVHETPCPGGCDPNTLACKTEFGVKSISKPKQP